TISHDPTFMALIENPILNSAFREPSRHFKFDQEGITNEIATGRRPSSQRRIAGCRFAEQALESEPNRRKVEQLTGESESAFAEIFRPGVNHAAEPFNKRANLTLKRMGVESERPG